MFDKLIESDSTGADFKPRRRYFFVSSIVVGLLFLSAVIFSIYAAEIGLGHDDFELASILAPGPPPETVPEPPQPRTQTQPTQAQSEVPIRIVNMARVDEIQPTPTSTSVVPNTEMARPEGRFNIGPRNIDPPSGIISAGPEGTGTSSEVVAAQPAKPEVVAAPVPPPIKVGPPKSIGVANGFATHLPKPPYPAAALAINIQGKVDVQVTIDETGKVISAKAASGHPLLRPAAERAAWGARFSPTLLSNVPVKVTGVIVYNFTRN